MKQLLLLAFIVMIVIIPVVSAIPTNGASSGYSEGFNLSSSGNAGDGNCWFKYSTSSSGMFIKTTNYTSQSGTCFGQIMDAFVFPSTSYYWTSCDSTGCSASLGTVSTTATTPVSVPTLSGTLNNLTQSNFNFLLLGYDALAPYLWAAGVVNPQAVQSSYALPIVAGLIIFVMFIASGVRTRGVLIPMILAMMLATCIFLPNSSGVNSLGISLPDQMWVIADAMLAAAIAGIIVNYIK